MEKANIVRVSISEAAVLLGISQKTIRRAIAEKEIGYTVVRDRYKVDLESLLRWSQTKPVVRARRDSQGIGRFVEKWKIRNPAQNPDPFTAQK